MSDPPRITAADVRKAQAQYDADFKKLERSIESYMDEFYRKPLLDRLETLAQATKEKATNDD